MNFNVNVQYAKANEKKLYMSEFWQGDKMRMFRFERKPDNAQLFNSQR